MIEVFSISNFWKRFAKQGCVSAETYSDNFFIIKLEKFDRLFDPPLSAIKMETHVCLFITRGEISITVGGMDRTIIEGECLIIPAGQVFLITAVFDIAGYLWSFHNDFTTEKYGPNQLLKNFELLNPWADPYINFDPEGFGYIHQITKRMHSDHSENGLRNPSIIQSQLMLILCEIDKYYDPEQNNDHSRSISLTKKFKHLLYRSIRTKQLVTDYAELLNITPNHLNKVVKQTTGKSPTKWIDEAVLSEAKVMLHHSNQTIAQIAKDIGLSGASYLRILFKKYTHMTPDEFRERVTKA